MTSKLIGLCLLEKTVFIICASMLLLQIFLSFHNYQQHDFVETNEDDELYNVDMPMIIVCAKEPFIENLEPPFYVGLDPNDQEGSFLGWTVENVSTHDHIKSNATVQNIGDLLEEAWIANTSWFVTERSAQLTQYFEPMRITFYDGQCFSLEVPKDVVRRHILGLNRFIITLGFKVDVSMKVFLHDPNILNGYFNRGEELAVDNGFYQMFDVALEQTIQSPDDQKVDCQSYAATNGSYNCVKEKFEEIFINLIKCVPPWFTDDQGKVCQYKDLQVAKQMITREEFGDRMLGKDIFLQGEM